MENLDHIIDQAVAAYNKAANERFAQDGNQDTGTCGSFMLEYRGNTKLAKALLERKLAHRIDGKVSILLRHSLPTQNMDVDCAGAKAFRAVLETAGYPASRYYEYVD